jgi:hypothetical protein
MHLCRLILAMCFLNFTLVVWGICEVLYEAMLDRESTFVGRVMRYFYGLRVADPPECSCECCSCAEDRYKGYLSPHLPRYTFFEFKIQQC